MSITPLVTAVIRSWHPLSRSEISARSNPGATIDLVLSLTLAILAGAANPAAGVSKATDSIDLATANQIVRDYAQHALKRLPPDWRQMEEKKWREEPPHIPAGGFFQMLLPDGQIGFEHDNDNKRLLSWAVVHKPRSEYPKIGLTRDEILTALERAVSTGVDTGGGEVVWDSEAEGYFLLRAFDRPEKNAKKMNKEIDRFVAAGEGWFREHYLEAVLSYAKTLAPPESATVRDGAFEVTLVLTPDKRYHELWHNPPGGSQPQLVSRPEYTRGQDVWAMALFSGATPGADGAVQYQAQYSFVHPDGKEEGSQVFWFWDGPPPPADHLQIVERRAAIELGTDNPAGEYLARVMVCNVATGNCVTAVTPFRLRP